MRIWIDIENAAGEKQGDGPIVTALNWVNVERLDRAGEFRFTVPAVETRVIDEIRHKRRVKCYGIVNGSVTLLGAGIIDKIGLTVSPDGVPLAVVGGDGILSELAYRSVGFLEIYEYTAQNPAHAEHLTGAVGTLLTNATDDNPATGDTIIISGLHYLYIGHPVPFPYIDFDLGGSVNNNAASLTIQYFDDTTEWTNATGTADTTASGGAPFAQDGRISFDMATSWVPMTHNDQTLYWIRIRPSVTLDSVDFREITIRAKTRTTDDLDLIMANAPAGWALDTGDWYGSTENGTISAFAGESVLAALIKTATKTGEHFRLGDGLEVEWLRADSPSSGIIAMQLLGNDPVAIEGNANVCLITALAREQDALGLITRIYPFGAGNGSARVTLENCTEAAPSGYTLNTTDNYIKADTPETDYGRIEAYVSFKEIGILENDAAGQEAASNELFTAALKYLQNRQSPIAAYRLSVTKLDGTLKPGETIRVMYQKPSAEGLGERILIDETLLVLETQTTIDQNGIRTTNLLVANMDRWPVDDDEILSQQLDQGTVYEAYDQPVDAASLANNPPANRYPVSSGWTTANYSSDTTLDGSTATLTDIINIVGTLIDALKGQGLFSA